MKHRSPLRSRLLAATGLVVVLGLLPWGQSEAARRTLHYDFPSSDLAVYSFEISHSVATEVIRLPPEAEAFDYQPVVDRIAAVETKLSGRLERFVGRAFRDGTLGLVARVVGLSGSVRRSDSSTPLSFPGLEGKSVSFRVSAGGELFDSTGWSHLLGAGRGGELARDVLLQSVLRLPVHLPKGSEAQGTSFTLRVPVDPSLERVNFWALRFVQGAAPTDCSQPCWALD